MELQHYDFCILGDHHPEGLLLAAALARKSFRVLLVPSENLGEQAPQEAWPMRIPERLGDRRLDELLFKAGFFRLEDAGLVPAETRRQILLRRHRLSFDGKRETWEREIRREFPQVADRILRLSAGKRPDPRRWSAAQACARDEPLILPWILLEGSEGRTASLESDEGKAAAIRRWLEDIPQNDSKSYELNPELQEPYTQFLVEHCRKWGVKVWADRLDLKSRWGRFQLAEGVEAKNLMLNSFAAFRQLGRLKSFEDCQKPISHWLYFDRIRLPLTQIPEPLGEKAFLQVGGQLVNSENAFVLHLERDKLRDEANLALGIWLPFQDSSHWLDRIQRARGELKKVIPFIPDQAVPSLPSSLELTEMKGECVRRGEVERLILEPNRRGRRRLFRGLFGGRRFSGDVLQHRRVVSLIPYMKPVSGRRESLLTCFELLDQYEKRSPKRAS